MHGAAVDRPSLIAGLSQLELFTKDIALKTGLTVPEPFSSAAVFLEALGHIDLTQSAVRRTVLLGSSEWRAAAESCVDSQDIARVWFGAHARVIRAALLFGEINDEGRTVRLAAGQLIANNVAACRPSASDKNFCLYEQVMRDWLSDRSCSPGGEGQIAAKFFAHLGHIDSDAGSGHLLDLMLSHLDPHVRSSACRALVGAVTNEQVSAVCHSLIAAVKSPGLFQAAVDTLLDLRNGFRAEGLPMDYVNFWECQIRSRLSGSNDDQSSLVAVAVDRSLEMPHRCAVLKLPEVCDAGWRTVLVPELATHQQWPASAASFLGAVELCILPDNVRSWGGPDTLVDEKQKELTHAARGLRSIISTNAHALKTLQVGRDFDVRVEQIILSGQMLYSLLPIAEGGGKESGKIEIDREPLSVWLFSSQPNVLEDLHGVAFRCNGDTTARKGLLAVMENLAQFISI